MSRTARAIPFLLLALIAVPGLVSAAEGRIAVAVRAGALHVHSLDGEKLASVQTAPGPRSVVAHRGKLFVANRGVGEAPGSTVTILDARSFELERTARVCAGCAPRDLRFDARGTMWFAGQAHRVVYWSSDPAAGPDGSVIVGLAWPSELAMSDDGELLAVAFRDGESVVVIDTTARSFSRTVATRVPTHVAARPGAREFWFASDIDGDLVRIRVAADGSLNDPEVLRSKTFAGGVAFTPDGRHAVVSDVARQTVSVLDAATGRQLGAAQVDVQPGLVAADPAGSRIAVLADGGTRVLVFSIAADGSISETGGFPIDGVGTALAWVP